MSSIDIAKFEWLVDNGHGQGNGNQSPDGSIREWDAVREIAALIVMEAVREGINAKLLVKELTDVPIYERVRRVNAECRRLGKENVALTSIHLNAAMGSGWHNARGFLPYIDPNAGSGSRRLARYLYEEIAEKRGLKGNRWISKDKYATKSLGMTRDTWCTAVLTENLYQDNKEDVAILLSDEGKRLIVEGHVAAIKRYVFS